MHTYIYIQYIHIYIYIYIYIINISTGMSSHVAGYLVRRSLAQGLRQLETRESCWESLEKSSP